MELNCGDFLLRPLQISDKESLAKYANNYNIWLNVRDRLPHPYTLDDAATFIEANLDADPVTSFAIDFNRECIGMIGFIPQEDVYRKSAEFGYWLGEPFWGRGIVTRAAQKLVAHVFENFDIERLYASIFETNKASMRVLEKAGFRFECIFEKAVIKNNRLMNEYRYSLLRPEAF